MLSADHPSHYENFPVASWLCPPHLRPAITAIYWYARTADDIADEGHATADVRLNDLAAYRADLYSVASSQDFSSRWLGIFTPLAEVIRIHALPVNLLNDLICAFEQDIRYTRDGKTYKSEIELLNYCRLSANPVGRLLLHLYGITEDAALQESDSICTALQLINFWQDLSQDIPRGRFYITEDACDQYDVSLVELLSLVQTKKVSKLVANNVATASAMMQRGARLCKRIPGRTGWELRFVVQGGLRILDKIKALDYAMLAKRPKLNKWDYVVIFWRVIGM